MGKVTSKLQLTLPKAVADRFSIRPGDEVEWTVAGDTIRVVPRPARGRRSRPSAKQDPAVRLRLFDAATERQRQREQARPSPAKRRAKRRGWSREDLYERGGPR